MVHGVRRSWARLVVAPALAAFTLALIPTVSAAADDFSPFVASWGVSGSLLVVQGSGAGDFTYRTYNMDCGDPAQGPCDTFQGNEILPGGDVTFQLASASGTTATGSIVQSNDGRYPTGAPAVLTLADNARLDLQLAGQDIGLLCSAATPSSLCGA